MSRVSGCFWVYGFQFRGFGGLGFACRHIIKARAEESFFWRGISEFRVSGFRVSGLGGLGLGLLDAKGFPGSGFLGFEG